MIKLIGIICIVVCGAGIGAIVSGNLKKQAELCVSVRTFLSELGILMKYRGDTLYDLISELSERQRVQELTFLVCVTENMSDGMSFPCAWQKALSEDKILSCELMDLLISFGESLGTSDINGQLMCIERAEEELSVIYENALSQCRRKGKLYRSMGLLGGMTAALLLC